MCAWSLESNARTCNTLVRYEGDDEDDDKILEDGHEGLVASGDGRTGIIPYSLPSSDTVNPVLSIQVAMENETDV